MPTPSLARVFFDKAVAGGAALLRELVANGQPETEWLDFKGCDRLHDNQLRAKWSEAICGFANNEGGVLIWGIDARFDEATETDVANGFRLADSPKALRDRLRELHPTATDPPVIGVESVAIFDNGTDGPGYVISFVPEGDVKPYRAELSAGKPYMLRIGSSFQNPSPSILRNLFFPHSSASVKLSVTPAWEPIRLVSGRGPSDNIEIRYELRLHNTGLVSIRNLFVIVETTPPRSDVNVPYGSQTLTTDTGIGIECSRPLHPSSVEQIGFIRYRVGTQTEHTESIKVQIPAPSPFAAKFRVFATDMQPFLFSLEIGDRDLKEKRQVWATPVTSDTTVAK